VKRLCTLAGLQEIGSPPPLTASEFDGFNWTSQAPPQQPNTAERILELIAKLVVLQVALLWPLEQL